MTLPAALVQDFPILSEYGVPFDRLEVTLTCERPTLRKGWTQAVLSPGVVDDAAKEWFGYGNCPLLAQAMHELSGWPYRVIEGVETGTWYHVGVFTPNGHFLDILGPRPDDEVIKQYQKPGTTARARCITFEEGVRHKQFPPEGWRGHSSSVAIETISYFALTLLMKAGWGNS